MLEHELHYKKFYFKILFIYMICQRDNINQVLKTAGFTWLHS